MTPLQQSFYRYTLLLACLLILATGCTTPSYQTGQEAAPNKMPTLKVGVSTNAPPFAYKAGGQLQGLEVDFARQLAAHLNREAILVEIPWDQQLSSLESGKIDIIMSGMTITPKRQYRALFTKPYMKSGQILLVRTPEAQRYSSGIVSLMGSEPAIGTIQGTTGDLFITRTINRPRLTRFLTSSQAVEALKKEEIDVLVHDAPIVCHYAAITQDVQLTPILQFGTEEYLAWAVNKTDRNLADAANGFLEVIARSGQLSTTIHRWIPYL